MVTECCSESRMRSWTSRGVPEWSGGKDLYMGSPVLVTGKVSGDIGNVPGPPGGSRGSTKWGHMLQRHTWAKYERAPAPRWARAPPTMAHAARRGEGANPKGIWALGPICRRVCPLPHFPVPWALWGGGAPAHLGLVPSHTWPTQPSGAGGPTWWTPGTLPVVPVRYR